MEAVADAGVLLSVPLVGHPRLRNDLRRPQMEEIGYRTTTFEYEGIWPRQRRDYVAWLLHACAAEGVKVADLMDEDAMELIADRLRTPLQIEMHLTLAFEHAYRLGTKPVSVDIVEQVLSRAIDELEPTLTRNGYDAGRDHGPVQRQAVRSPRLPGRHARRRARPRADRQASPGRGAGVISAILVLAQNASRADRCRACW